MTQPSAGKNKQPKDYWKLSPALLSDLVISREEKGPFSFFIEIFWKKGHVQYSVSGGRACYVACRSA